MYFSILPLAIEGDSISVQPDLPFRRNEETDRACAVIPGALATRVVMDLRGKIASYITNSLLKYLI